MKAYIYDVLSDEVVAVVEEEDYDLFVYSLYLALVSDRYEARQELRKECLKENHHDYVYYRQEDRQSYSYY